MIMKCKWCDKEAVPGKEFCADCQSILDKKKGYKVYEPKQDPPKSSNVAIATILTTIGIIMLIIGFFSLIALIDSGAGELGILFLIASLISACLFFGFSKVIELLQEISNKLN